jgi:hypothetical protein
VATITTSVRTCDRCKHEIKQPIIPIVSVFCVQKRIVTRMSARWRDIDEFDMCDKCFSDFKRFMKDAKFKSV